jgi:hypothetical protein
MSSIHEVFDRVEKWKASETLLQVTVRGAGQNVQVMRCTICASDREAGHVDVVFGFKKFARFDMTDAQFRIGKHAIEASRTGDVLLVFEEIQDPRRESWAGRHTN